MDTWKENPNRSEKERENQEHKTVEDGERLDDDELDVVVGGWSKRDAAQQPGQADWVW